MTWPVLQNCSEPKQGQLHLGRANTLKVEQGNGHIAVPEAGWMSERL